MRKTPKLGLGKRPADDRPLLDVGAHLTAAAFTPPASVDYASKVSEWVLGSNDRFGTCGPTSVANLALLVSTVLTGSATRYTDEEVFDLYRRSGNPNFDPKTGADDNGVIMADLLAALVKGGIGSGDRNVKAVAFGKVNPADEAQVFAAASLFGGVLIGANLRAAQETQFEAGKSWDYVARSKAWGGHAMLAAPDYTDAAGTTADRTGLVTWATLTDATDAFFDKQVDEAYVVIFPWHLGDARFLAGINLDTLAAEFKALTGRDFPVQPAPINPPAPTPPAPTPPAPAPAADFPAAALSLAMLSLSQVTAWAAKNGYTVS